MDYLRFGENWMLTILTRIVNGEAIDESEDKSLYATCFPESERFSLINLDK